MFPEIPHLGEPFPTNSAQVRFNSLVHADMVEQVPNDSKRAIAVFMLALVHFAGLLAVLIVDSFNFVLIAFEDLDSLRLLRLFVTTVLLLRGV